jgi:hypothetical protein
MKANTEYGMVVEEPLSQVLPVTVTYIHNHHQYPYNSSSSVSIKRKRDKQVAKKYVEKQ